MKALVHTANGRATVYQDENGVHVLVTEKGKSWEAGVFSAEDYQELPKAWASALALARKYVGQGGAA